MMIRPAELAAIRAGTVDLAFRRWDRPRVKVGTRMRTGLGVVEVTSVEQVTLASLTADDARRAGAPSLAALRRALAPREGQGTRPVHRVGLTWGGADPREELRARVPGAEELAELLAWLDRLDAASGSGPWTAATLRIIDDFPERRAPELAAQLGRETAPFKTDVRKLKERGLTESLAIGYRISPRGEAVVDALRPEGPRTDRAPRRDGTPLPRSIGAPATRALRGVEVHTLEQVARWRRADLAALHGVGPVALARLDEALREAGLEQAP